MRIAVIGAGYVGLVTGACLADLGHHVVCVEKDRAKVRGLKRARLSIFEPGLKELVERNLGNRLTFTQSYMTATRTSRVIFIAVGTPPKRDGEADLSAVEAAAVSIREHLDSSYRVVVNKSTVPVGTARWLEGLLASGSADRKRGGRSSFRYDVVANPEFLRGGSAVKDFTMPDRIVIGCQSGRAAKIMEQVYRPLRERARRMGKEVPMVITDTATAEMIKYAANAFLATKISFVNEMANICEVLGADVVQLSRALGMDPRIGADFLSPGVGFGGSCLPKDLSALTHLAQAKGYSSRLLHAVASVNLDQRLKVLQKLEGGLGPLAGKRIALLGLAYKPNTNDLRDAVSLTVIGDLLKRKAQVRGYDPVVGREIAAIFPEVVCCSSPYQAARGCDALVLLTEWDELLSLDYHRLRRVMRGSLVVDGRNCLDPLKVREAGLTYVGFGR